MLQVLVLSVEGRVLTPHQRRTGLFILPSEAALAKTLLQGGAWMPCPSDAQPVNDESPGRPHLRGNSLSSTSRSYGKFYSLCKKY